MWSHTLCKRVSLFSSKWQWKAWNSFTQGFPIEHTCLSSTFTTWFGWQKRFVCRGWKSFTHWNTVISQVQSHSGWSQASTHLAALLLGSAYPSKKLFSNFQAVASCRPLPRLVICLSFVDERFILKDAKVVKHVQERKAKPVTIACHLYL